MSSFRQIKLNSWPNLKLKWQKIPFPFVDKIVLKLWICEWERGGKNDAKNRNFDV